MMATLNARVLPGRIFRENMIQSLSGAQDAERQYQVHSLHGTESIADSDNVMEIKVDTYFVGTSLITSRRILIVFQGETRPQAAAPCTS